MEQKKHFLALDGLRGIAAIAVVVFHFFEFVFPDFEDSPLGHGYLAVDFFFCLSGFVIGYAYDDRAGKISYTSFFKNRIIRLHPLVIIGSIIGVILFLLDPWAPYPRIWSSNLVGIPFIQSLFLIPTSIEVPNRYGNIFPFNPPAWSLFAEYVVNIFYIFILWKMRRILLPFLLVIAAGLLVYIAQKAGTLSGGWSYNNILDGLARVAFSFILGLIIKRYNLIISNRIGYLLLSLLLLGALAIPYFGINWIVETAIVFFIFPLITALGAGTTISDKLQPLASFMGKISYPLYMCHYWFISSFGNYYIAFKPTGSTLVILVTTSTLGLIALAYIIQRWIDEPIRNVLRKKWGTN